MFVLSPETIVKLIVAAVIAAMVGGAFFYVEHEKSVAFKAGAADAKRLVEEKTAIALVDQRIEADKKITNVEAAHAQDLARAAKLAVDVASLRAQRDGLLARLRDPGAAAETASAAEAGPAADGPPYRELLGACTEQYVGVAEGAGRLTDQVIGLQDYICAATGIRGDSPVGARLCAGDITLVIQPTTAPPGFNSGAVAPPIGGAP